MSAKSKAAGPDPITTEIVFNALQSVADESFVALMKSAYSTNIKERHDHSTAIVDRTGRLVVQASGSIPIHLASMLGLMQKLLAKYPVSEIHEGDVFCANDPHVGGGTHLPDVNLAMPVFADGELVGFVCNIAHHADVGGMSPGSMAGGMTSIYQEGLRIPLIKLFRRGQLDQDLFDLILLNVRVVEERRGDYNAQFAALRLAHRRLLDIIDRNGRDTVSAVFDGIIERTYARMKESIAAIPDGTYRFEDFMDNDGAGLDDIRIALAVTIDGDNAVFDFTGTQTQVPGNVNIPLNGTIAAVCYVLKAMLDPEIPNNHGVIDAVTVTAPSGTVVSCVEPASVASRAHTSQRIVDVVIGALADALPDKAVGAANGANSMAIFAGTDPRSGRPYVYLETLGGGFGGRNDRDGKDGVQVHITNTSNLPVEAIEMEYPLLVEAYGLIEDSGGAGTWRGGLGLRRVVTPVDHDCVFTGIGERFRHQPWGVFGGKPGGSGKFSLETRDGAMREMPTKFGDALLREGERAIVETPGSGGYGPPEGRLTETLTEDWDSGKFSAGYMRRHYDWVPPSRD